MKGVFVWWYPEIPFKWVSEPPCDNMTLSLLCPPKRTHEMRQKTYPKVTFNHLNKTPFSFFSSPNTVFLSISSVLWSKWWKKLFNMQKLSKNNKSNDRNLSFTIHLSPYQFFTPLGFYISAVVKILLSYYELPGCSAPSVLQHITGFKLFTCLYTKQSKKRTPKRLKLTQKLLILKLTYKLTKKVWH